MSGQSKIARRTFFSALGLAAAAGVAAKLSSSSVLPDSGNPAPPDPKGNGYRLTEHIKKYYRSTII